MSNVLQRLGAGAAALAAPFVVLTASPGALAEDCKQAPPPQSSLLSNPPSKRAYMTDVSKPVLIADANPPAVAQALQPNCTQPSQPSAATFLRNSMRAVQEGQRDLRETLRNLPPIPGS